MATGLSFSELTHALQGVKDSPKEKEPRLCDNIFDVQRHDLYTILSQLRTTFWSDPVQHRTRHDPVNTVAPVPTSPTNTAFKRRASDDNEVLPSPSTQKRARILSTLDSSVPPPPLKDPGLAQESSKSHKESRAIAWTRSVTRNPTSSSTLTVPVPRSRRAPAWTPSRAKRQHRLLRLIRNEKCNATQLIWELQQMPDVHEQRFLARYLIPVAQAMRRQALVDALLTMK